MGMLSWEWTSFFGYVMILASMLSVTPRVCINRSLAHTKTALLGFRTQTRRFSTVNLDPVVRDFTRVLVQKQPCIAMSSDDVQVLTEPRQFYELILVCSVIALRTSSFSRCLFPGHGAARTATDIHLLLVHWRKRKRTGVLLSVFLGEKARRPDGHDIDQCVVFSSPREPLPPSLYPTRSQPLNASRTILDHTYPSPSPKSLPRPSPYQSLPKSKTQRHHGETGSPSIQRRMGNMAR